MENSKPQLYFLLALLLITLVLLFFILRPFLFVIILAIVFAVMFQPLYRKILKYAWGHESLSAFLSTIIIVILIFAPLLLLGGQIFQESKDLYISLYSGNGKDFIVGALNKLADFIHSNFPNSGEITINIDEYLKQALSWLLRNLGSAFSNFAKILLTAFLFIISLYYLLKDGNKLRKKAFMLSPLNDADDEKIAKKLEMAINSVVKGNFMIAFIQGLLTALGFAIFGVPNPILWGMAASIAALIPTVGTSLIFIPAIILMLVSGQLFSAVGLLLWGLLAVGLIDNFLAPKVIGGGMRLHPLLVMLAVLGGISFFGPIGFILGPIVLSLLFALLDIYSFVVEK